MSNPTFEQAKHILMLVEEKKKDCGELQTLINSGLLSDLLEADLKNVDINQLRIELKKILGLSPWEFRVKIGGAKNTDEIIAPLGSLVDQEINQENFPLTPPGPVREVMIEIIKPRRETFNRKDGLVILEENGLNCPTHQHAIHFAEQYGKIEIFPTREPVVVFLNEAYQTLNCGNSVLCFSCTHLLSRRRIYPSYFKDNFFANCMLAGVQPHKK